MREIGNARWDVKWRGKIRLNAFEGHFCLFARRGAAARCGTSCRERKQIVIESYWRSDWNCLGNVRSGDVSMHPRRHLYLSATSMRCERKRISISVECNKCRFFMLSFKGHLRTLQFIRIDGDRKREFIFSVCRLQENTWQNDERKRPAGRHQKRVEAEHLVNLATYRLQFYTRIWKSFILPCQGHPKS